MHAGTMRWRSGHSIIVGHWLWSGPAIGLETGLGLEWEDSGICASSERMLFCIFHTGIITNDDNEIL